MKTAVVYYSQSGNTAKVGEAIARALGLPHGGADAAVGRAGSDVVLAPIAEAPPLDDRELVFVGMPVERFGAPEPVQRFLAGQCAGRRVALFVTHAAPDETPDLAGWLDACEDAAAGSDLVGFFHCQGRLAEPVKQAMLASGMPMLVQFAQMADCAAGQPDAAALARAADFARVTLARAMGAEDALGGSAVDRSEAVRVAV